MGDGGFLSQGRQDMGMIVIESKLWLPVSRHDAGYFTYTQESQADLRRENKITCVRFKSLEACCLLVALQMFKNG